MSSMTQYLIDSERTLAGGELHTEVFESQKLGLRQTIDVVQAGASADAIKRAFFYNDQKIAERLQKAGQVMANLYKTIDERKDDITLTAEEVNLFHAILGIASEAGELAEELISAKVENREVDKQNIFEEAGDIMWYLALMLRYLDTSFEAVGERNIAKLAARYPEKFSTEQALNRDLDAEKVALGG